MKRMFKKEWKIFGKLGIFKTNYEKKYTRTGFGN